MSCRRHNANPRKAGRRQRSGRDLILIFLSFELPGEEEHFVFLAEIRQMRAINDGDDVRLGLKIKPWPSRREVEHTRGRLQRYLTALQRAKLKRSA